MKALKILVSLLLLITCLFFTFSCNRYDETIRIEREEKTDKNDNDEDEDNLSATLDDFIEHEDYEETISPSIDVSTEDRINRSLLTSAPAPLYNYYAEKYCYVDYDGNVVIDPIFDSAYYFDGDLAEVAIESSYAFINRDGEYVTEFQSFYYDDVNYESDFWSYYYDESSELYGFADNNDDIVISAVFKDVWAFCEGVAPATLDGENWGFINESGDFIIDPIYENASEFSEGYAAVCYDGKWGFINLDGTMVLDAKYYEVNDFYLGLAKVCENNLDFFYIDKNGNKVAEADSYYHKDLNPHESDNWYYTTDNETGLYGFIDNNDDYVIPCRFIDVWSFNNGLAPATLDGENWGYIDESGEFVIPAVFDAAYEFGENGLASVSVDGYDALVNLDGTIHSLY